MSTSGFHEGLVSLSMGANFVSTDAENEVIKNAQRRLGQNLSTFLLSGYGQTYETKKRAFTAVKYEAETKITYRFETINDGEVGLPSGKSPAVFAALLGLCSTQSKRIGDVLFDVDLIVRMLGWTDLPEARLLIVHGVEQYFSTGYYKVSKHLPKHDLLGGRYSRYIRLVEYYKTYSEISNDDPATETLSILVRLAPGFIEDIATEQKYFFDMDFEGFTSFRQVK